MTAAAAQSQHNKVRRVRRLPGGRRHVVGVRLSDEELVELRRRAATAGKSPQLFLLELALADPVNSHERRAVHTILLEARRTLVGLATNVNQLAKVGNTDGRLPVGTKEALAAVAAMTKAVEVAATTVAARVGGAT